MKTNCSTDVAVQNLVESVIQRDKQERLAIATSTTTEVLTKLNISIDGLPQKCQKYLRLAAEVEAATDIEQLDAFAISLHHTKLVSEQVNDEYEIFKLEQKNRELQAKIDRNNRFLDDLMTELESSRNSLTMRSPNPDTVQEVIRQLKMKVTSYEESFEKAKAKYSKLPVSECTVPAALVSLGEAAARRRAEEARVRVRADDVRLAHHALDTLKRLR